MFDLLVGSSLVFMKLWNRLQKLKQNVDIVSQKISKMVKIGIKQKKHYALCSLSISYSDGVEAIALSQFFRCAKYVQMTKMLGLSILNARRLYKSRHLPEQLQWKVNPNQFVMIYI